MNGFFNYTRTNLSLIRRFEKLPHGLTVKFISNSTVKNDEGFMSRFKKLFGQSSAQVEDFGRMKTCQRDSRTFSHHHEKSSFVLYGGFLRTANLNMKTVGISKRQMSILSSLKAAMGLNPRNSKPVPIREPNIPQKPVDRKKEEKQKNEKPVLRTDQAENVEEVTHVRSAMMDEHGKPVTEDNFVRTEWGVRIKDKARKVDPQVSDSKTDVKKPFYFEKSLWGVNVKQFLTRNDEPQRANDLGSNRRHQTPETTPGDNLDVNVSSAKSEIGATETHVERSALSSYQNIPEDVNYDSNSPDIKPGGETNAWKELTEKSLGSLVRRKTGSSSVKAPGMFLQPEPPIPKKDVKSIPPIWNFEAELSEEEMRAKQASVKKVGSQKTFFGKLLKNPFRVVKKS